MSIYTIIASLLIFLFVGFFLLPLVLLIQLILTIFASVQVSKGHFYRYPLSIRFLR